MNLYRSTALSISQEKREEDTKSKAFQTACCSPVRIVFWAKCFFIRDLLSLWSGWYKWIRLCDSELWLEDGWGIEDVVSLWVEADSTQTWVEGPVGGTYPGTFRWERFTLFLSLSFARDLSRASLLKSSISCRNSNIILVLSSARDSIVVE